MKPRVLLFDDEPNALEGLRRQLHGQFEVVAATGGSKALLLLASQGPFAVVVSDLKMPQMDGIELLQHIERRAPETVRILFTGHADLGSAVHAVNEGHVYRFVEKPCEKAAFATHLNDAVAEHKRRRREREVLDETVKGTVRVLSDLLSVIAPESFSRAERVRRLAHYLADRCAQRHRWDIEVAALLSPLGEIVLPNGGEDASGFDSLQAEQARLGERLLSSIPRLENAALLIGAQLDPDNVEDEGNRKAARVLKTALELDMMLGAGEPWSRVLARARVRGLDDAFLEQLKDYRPEVRYERRELAAEHLRPGMLVDEDVVSSTGVIILRAGAELNRVAVERLRTFARGAGLQAKIAVRVATTA